MFYTFCHFNEKHHSEIRVFENYEEFIKNLILVTPRYRSESINIFKFRAENESTAKEKAEIYYKRQGWIFIY